MIQKQRVFFLGILALLFLLFIVILQLKYYSIIFPVIFGILGLIFFIVLDWFSESVLKRDKEIKSEAMLSNFFLSRVSFKILTVLFLIFYSFGLLSLLLGDYTKNILYYLCISVCAAILIFEIFSVKSVFSRHVILFQTFLLSLNIVFANHLIFIHGISQPDFGLHISLVRDILTLGHISTNTFGYYNIFAVHHVFASEGALLTGYNPQSIYLLFGSLIIAIGVLFVFLIGKRFVNFKFGLVAAVLFTCLDFYLMEGEHPEHVAYSFGFALVCFTIILFTYRSQKSAFYLLFVLSAVVMVLTHHLSALIVFVTICSLVLIDIFHIVQTRERSLPSKYITPTFAILLFTALYIVSDNSSVQLLTLAFKPYFTSIYSLITNFFAAPAPVVSIPVIPIPVTPIPVIPIPVTPIPVIPIPVIPIPVTPVPIPTPPYVPPTGYDKLPFVTLFVNTLGSSLLVLVSILGFCSLLKKRSWFGDYTIINAILISFLLGIGILFPVVVFLPDRMYPFLQIFCLVFLGAFGIHWLRNSIPIGNGLIVTVGICILVGMMSFFALASIINGFETSPFVGENVAYSKLYTTSQDVSFGVWRNSFIHDKSRKVVPLPINNKGMMDIDNLPGNQYLIFDRTLQKTGILKSGNIFGQHSFVSFDNGQLQQLNFVSSYYDNGLINLMAKNAPS